MADTGEPSTYYVISDLHIGGDEQLEEVDFLDELLAFLAEIRERDESAELIINGDAFGLWEFTGVSGPEKFDILLDTYPKLFDALERTGAEMSITLLPGNHDHELAAYEEFVDRFAEFNVDLVRDPELKKPLAGRTIHFEHGNQVDPNNRFEDFGNPHEKPLGYYYNTHVISRAGHLSDRGRFNWLKDIQAVTPTQRIASWLFSKYFYREMNPVLRYAAVPFLLLFNVSAILAIMAGLDVAGLWSMPVERTTAYLAEFGLAGTAVWWLLAVNISIAGLLLLVGIPTYFFVRDFRKTVDRFGVFETDLTVDPERPYIADARAVFSASPETAIYCFGHTHRPMIRELDGRLLVNSGTWLKRLHRRDVVAGVLPPVFYPSYQLSAVRIAAEDDAITVAFEPIDKPSPSAEELTLTERLLTLGREPSPRLPAGVSVPVERPRPTPEPTGELA